MKAFLFIIMSLSVLLRAEEPFIQIEDKTEYPLLLPSLQSRKTAKIQLSNGVQAYLISDPNLDQSAASVSMEAGSWQDPSEYPGMAHFLEHMLFMGSTAYPEESEYMEYIQDNGGTVNAFTAPDRTVYLFSINNNAFVGALDRFSHFFIDPLFSPSSIQRELHAVDQEHAKNVENDFWRMHMVLKETSSSKHPHSKFSTGNAATLGGIPPSAVKQWYEDHYSADKLHVILLSPLPIEQLIELTVEKFSPVPLRKNKISTPLTEPILSAAQKGHFLYIQPIRDLKLLSLLWELPPSFSTLENINITDLVAYTLEQASDQSLIQLLRREGLAEDLSANTERYGKDRVFFRINIALTELGLSQVDLTINRCFEMLARLRQSGLSSSLFQERQALARIHYQYPSKEEAFSWISALAYAIIDEDLSTFPEQGSVPSHFHPEALVDLLGSLTPDSAVYVLLADLDKMGVLPTKTETWMNVPYEIQAISPTKLYFWSQIAPNPVLLLPPENPFIPTSLDIAHDHTSTQEIIWNDSKGCVYFACDEAYLSPEVAFSFTIKSPFLNGSFKSQVCMDLLCRILTEQLSSSLFFANTAGLSTRLLYKDFGLDIALSGYSAKAPELAKQLFLAISSFSCSEKQFSLHKTALQSSYANDMQVLPVKQALNTLSNLLLQSVPTPEEKLQTLQLLSQEEFLSFSEHWLDSLYIEGVVFGNLSKNDATALCHSLFATFSLKDSFSSPIKQKLLLLPKDLGPFKVQGKTERQGNGIILSIQQGPFSFQKQASQQILSTVLHETFFATLRTKQQTAYMAHAWASCIDKQLMQNFSVQSSTHLPEDLLHRFELFLEDFTKRIQEILPHERFSLLKENQIASLQIPLDDMRSMAGFIKELAFTYEGDFLHKDKQIQALQDLSYEDMLADAREFFSRSNGRRLAILIEGIQSNPFVYKPITKEEVLQMGSFSPSPQASLVENCD